MACKKHFNKLLTIITVFKNKDVLKTDALTILKIVRKMSVIKLSVFSWVEL